MRPHVSLPVSEPSQVGEARRIATALAVELGLDETRAGRAGLVATELGNNLVRHAGRGQLLIGFNTVRAGRWMEVLSLDAGPGMADMAQCLRDGYSTAGTPGTGLGAVQRLADEFSMHSAAGQGTVVLARIGHAPANGAAALPASMLDVAGLCLAAPGERVSGDAWHFAPDQLTPGLGRLLVADGLGHGADAALAADTAVRLFQTLGGGPSQILTALHTPLRGTRGAAAALALLDASGGTLTFAGAGNIAGRLVSGIEDRALLSQHGTLGVQVRKLADAAYPWSRHACLVMHSDGLATRWRLEGVAGLLQCDPAVIAGWLLRDHLRGRDDATVVVARQR